MADFRVIADGRLRYLNHWSCGGLGWIRYWIGYWIDRIWAWIVGWDNHWLSETPRQISSLAGGQSLRPSLSNRSDGCSINQGSSCDPYRS